jgi:hypothetical protein
MRLIRGSVIEANLRVARDFEIARPIAVIEDRYRANFGGHVRNDANGPTRFEAAVPAVEFRHVGVEGELEFSVGRSKRSPFNRPRVSVDQITKVTALSPSFARRVFTPASDVKALIRAGARPRVRHDDAVSPVRQ